MNTEAKALACTECPREMPCGIHKYQPSSVPGAQDRHARASALLRRASDQSNGRFANAMLVKMARNQIKRAMFPWLTGTGMKRRRGTGARWH